MWYRGLKLFQNLAKHAQIKLIGYMWCGNVIISTTALRRHVLGKENIVVR